MNANHDFPLALALAITPFAFVFGCGSNVGTAGGGGTTASTTTASSSSSSTTTTTTSTSGAEPTPCGGTTGLTCGPGFYCNYLDSWCGAGVTGTCEAQLSGCYDEYYPICGCDGQVYDTICLANQAGVDGDDRGHCPVPDGYFACGAKFCAIGEEYCVRTIVSLDEPGAFVCPRKPDACGESPVSCGCLTAEPCSDVCEGTAESGVTVTCTIEN